MGSTNGDGDALEGGSHDNSRLWLAYFGEELRLAREQRGMSVRQLASHQYSGALGGVGRCQVAVHLAYAFVHGHAPVGREVYLPAGWAAGGERRLLRHVPDSIAFATKPHLAAAMLQRARELGLPARWFVGDEVYGSLDLRRTARTLGFDYALHARPPEDADALFLMYAVLMRAKGVHVTEVDVHDAWAAWMETRNPQHPALVPFESLDRPTQSQDLSYVQAIHSAARDRGAHKAP